MTETQRTLDNYAQSSFDESTSENGESGSCKPPEVNKDSPEACSNSPDSVEGMEDNHEHKTPDSNSAQASALLRSGSGLQFGKDPDEFNISCKWARRYLAHRTAKTLKKKPLGEGSVPTYENCLRHYVNYIQDHDSDVLSADFDLFEKFLLYCIESGRRSSSVIMRLRVTRQLYKHIKLKEEVDASISPLEFEQIDTAAIKELTLKDIKKGSLSRDELEKLFESMKNERDRLMAIVGAETGFRNSDIRNIRLDDVDLEEPEIFAKDPKGSKPYTVPISDDLALKIKIWIETGREAEYGHIGSEYLFPSKLGTKLSSGESLVRIISDAAKKAGIQNVIGRSEIEAKYVKKEKIDKTWMRVTPHILRHSFITILEEEGVSLEYRQLLANHSSAETTRRYSHGKKDLLKQAQERVNLSY